MGKRTLFTIRCAAAVLAILWACGAANAQVLYGSLTGNVADPSGAPIPGAKVEALNTGTGVGSQTTTDDRGVYRFVNIQTGVYRITVGAASFKTIVESNVIVNANEVRRVDFPMQIAVTNEKIEVSAAAAVLQTDKADVHAEVTSQEVTELPYAGGEGKNFQSLLYLIPGAGIPSSREANSEAGNPVRAQTLFMNGVSSQANSTRLDGATIAYPWLPVNVAYVPPEEAIQEVNVVTDAFDAEQGMAGGAATNVQIKSGTNQLHGSAFERNQNNAMTAVNYFSHTSPINKNIFNQFGFSLGGPIYIPKIVNGKNKLFFFVDFQGTRRRQYASTPNLTLPTQAMRTGDFSATGVTVYDPLTGNLDGTGRTPFANNQIPSNRISAAATTMAGLLPALTRPNLYTLNYDAYGGTEYNRNDVDAKTNYNPSDKTMIWGRYSISPLDIVAPLVLGLAGGDAFGGGNPIHAGGRVQTTAAGFTYTISPTFLVDANAGYTRQNIGANGDEYQGDYGLDVLHIPGTNGIGPNYMGQPGFQVTGIANMGNTNTGSPFLFRDNQYTSVINLSKIKGPHSLRFGFEYDKYALNHFQPQGGTFGTARGTFGFDGTLTSLCTVGNGTKCTTVSAANAVNYGGVPANSWAQFLLGDPSHAGKITQFQNPNALRFSSWALYARDQWQVSNKLTIDYGLRWEYYPIFSHNWYGAVRFDPSTDNVLIGGEGGVPWDTGASASKKGFAPRFGMAYRLGSKSVIRAGYGISVDPDNMRNQRNSFPSVVNQDYTPANTYQFIMYPGTTTPLTLVNGLPLPIFQDISQGKLTPAATSTTTTFAPTTNLGSTFPAYFNRGYIQSWNFFIQHEFSPTLTAEAGYVGTHAVHIDMNVNINGSAPGTGNAGRQLYPALATDLNDIEPFGNSTYNALQTRLKKRIGASLIGLAYTFSKAINNVNGDNNDGTMFRAYPMSFALNKALAGFDRTHILQLYHVYQLPFGKEHTMLNHGVAAQVFGGWQIGGIIGRFSGVPFTVAAASGTLNAGGQSQSADQINPVVNILGGHDSLDPYFDGTAFAAITTARLGSTGRNILRGPGWFSMDENISRTFAFKEGKLKLQLIGEGFNVLNHVNFANPANTFAAPTYNADGTVKSYGNFSVITSTYSSPRQLQVGAYIRF